jgi:hypothetical protein
MSFGRVVKGMAIGCAASVAMVASIALLVSARLGDVRELQTYHCNRTREAVRRMHLSLMQGDNYRRLFPQERADEIRSMASLVVHAMVVQVDPLYQQDAIDFALNNLTQICSEELT